MAGRMAGWGRRFRFDLVLCGCLPAWLGFTGWLYRYLLFVGLWPRMGIVF